jgi:MFS family permease
VGRVLTRSIYFVQFLMALAIGVVFVFFADLQDDFGLSGTEVGVVASMGFVAALVSQLALSPLIDRGHASGVAWLSVAMSVAGSVGFGLGSSTWVFATSRGMALIGLDIAGGGAKVGTLLSSAIAGFIIGPAIGGGLGTISFGTPFFVIGAVTLVPGIVAARVIGQAEVATAPVDYGDLRALLRRPRIQAALLTQLVVFGFIGIFDATVDRYLTDVGLSTTQVAVGLVVVGSPMLVLPTRAGALAERVGGARVVVPAVLAAIPVVFLFGFVNGMAMFVVVGMIYAGAEAFANMGAQVLVLEAAGAERAAVGSALLEAVGMAVASVTAAAGPPIYGAYGEVTLFGGWAAFGVGCLAVMVLRLRSVRQPPLFQPAG